MVIVRCVLKKKKLYSIMDDEFVDKAGMDKLGEGYYRGFGNSFNTSFTAAKRVFKNPELVKNLKSFTRELDGDEEDLFELYDYMVEKGEIKLPKEEAD